MDHTEISLNELVLLDVGGQSKIYVGKMTSSKCLEPVSVVAKDLTNTKGEDLIMKDLNHDNIIKFYGIVMSPTPYLLLEYLENGNLENYISDKYETLKLNVMQKIKGMIEGIYYIHCKGVLHLDLHPKNILVSGSEHCCNCFKITDFGLSKLEEDGALFSSHKGRPGYMSPENIRDEKITKDADIWALGCILWKILTQNEPFNFLDNQAKHFKVGSNMHPDIPNDWPVIIQKILFNCWDSRCKADELLKLFNISIRSKKTEIYLKKSMPLSHEYRFIQINSNRIIPAIIWNCVDKKNLFSKYNFIDNELIKRFEKYLCRRKFKKVRTVEDLLKLLNESGYFFGLRQLNKNIINSTEMISKLTTVVNNRGSDWKRIARSLGMPDIHIDEISNETSDEIVNEILEFWSENHSTHSFTYSSLEKILLHLHIKIE